MCPSVHQSVCRSVYWSVGRSIHWSVHPSVTHELKPCKNAVFNQSHYQYERGRILCRVYGLVLFLFSFWSSHFLPLHLSATQHKALLPLCLEFILNAATQHHNDPVSDVVAFPKYYEIVILPVMCNAILSRFAFPSPLLFLLKKPCGSK